MHLSEIDYQIVIFTKLISMMFIYIDFYVIIKVKPQFIATVPLTQITLGDPIAH